LELVGLTDRFAGRIFSAADIERGKPHPDIFLKAASGLNADPRDCIVIEDGTLGVRGAVAAGMTVIGLTAGSHCAADHADRLRQAGAHVIAAGYGDVALLVQDFAT
jgi:beta-phosphoglucomutase-like phosphatase (HAD superfamily)